MELIICLSLLGYCLIFTRLANRSIEYAPFFVISAVITLLYCFAYWHFLKTGTNSILLIGGGLLLLSPIYLRNKQHWEKCVTPGAVISVGFLALFLLLAHNLHFSAWDEFTHWGPHSKLVFLNNGFYRASHVTIHESYPLGSALFQYLFFRFGYSEGSAYVAQCLLAMAPLSILLYQFHWSNWKRALLAYALAIGVLLLLHVQIGFKETLYMDAIVGIYVGMSLVAYLSSPKNISSILFLLPIVIALGTFKQKLLPFVLLIACIIFLDQCIHNRKKWFVALITVATLPLSSMIMTHSWHHYLNIIQVPIQWGMQLSFKHFGTAQYAIINHYLHALLSSFSFVFIALLLSLLTYFCYTTKIKKINLISIQIALLLGFIAYSFGLLLMYLFAFGVYEATYLASMSRYLHIYYIAWSLVTLYFLYDATKNLTYTMQKSLESICVTGCFMALVYVIQYHPKPQVIATQQLRQPIAIIANAVKKYTPAHSKIFTLWENSVGFERAVLAYELMPRKPNLGCTSVGKSYVKNDVWTCDITPQNLLQQISQFDYLLLAYTDKNFWKQYQIILPYHVFLKPLVTYTICKGKGFNSFSGPGCKMRKYHAYLFRIIHKDEHILFHNVV